jgi:hypothetical protein
LFKRKDGRPEKSSAAAKPPIFMSIVIVTGAAGLTRLENVKPG